MPQKIALITGAGTGIGKNVAHHLMRAGYFVVFTGRRLGVLEEALKEGEGEGLALAMDVANPEDVAKTFQEIEQRFGRLDVLFNNAGIFVVGKEIDDLSVEEWQNAVNINLSGAVYCAKAAFSLMKKQNPQGGRIINNGSISAYAPRPGSVPYTVTKHGITGLTKCLSLDGRAYNIACSQIDIGNAETEMAKPLSKGAKQADGSMAPEPLMNLDNVGEAVLQMAELPLTTNIQFMTIMATNMPYLGRG